jgi:hypothetical protein
MQEAILIILCLGGLEVLLWYVDRMELKEQTQLLEDIMVTLSIKETDDSKEKKVEPTSHN